MRMLGAVLAILAFAAPPDRTVITRDGKVHVGAVTREGTVVVVVTTSGTVRLPAISVVADFASLPQARRACEARLEEATKLFEEGTAKPERDPMRRLMLGVTLDICAETRDLIEILERRSPASERDALAAAKGRLFQFMRMVRDAKGATATADGASDAPIEKVAFESIGLAVEPMPESAQASEISDRLGSGQVSFAAGLESDDAATRAQAAGKLTSPPAPHALPALAKAMRTEKDGDALQAIVAALMPLDLGPRLATDFSWAVADEEVDRRLALIALVRFQPAGPALDFLGECFRSKPPADPRTRAAFASAFRRLRPRAVEELRKALRTKDAKLQLEAVKQLGMMRDRAALPSLKLAMGGSRDLHTAAFNAVEKTGTVAIPLILELLGETNDEIRRVARILAQRVTREEIDGPAELQKWFLKNRKYVEDDEKLFWKEQEEKGFPVNPDEFKIYDRKIPSAKDMRE